MQKIRSILAASALVLMAAGPAFAQAEGYMPDVRASKIMNVTVVNDKNEKIGTIQDIILSDKGGEPSAVLSVDGMHKMVKVPFSHLHVMADKAVMPGKDGMKDMVKSMPAFEWMMVGG